MNTCATCFHPYNGDDGIQRCRVSSNSTRLEAEVEDHKTRGCAKFLPKDLVGIVPGTVARRWQQELTAANNLRGWRSLSIMCLEVSNKAGACKGFSELADDMATLSLLARQHMLNLQPEENHEDH